MEKLFYINLKFIYKYKVIIIISNIHLANFLNPFLGLISASTVYSERDCKCTEL